MSKYYKPELFSPRKPTVERLLGYQSSSKTTFFFLFVGLPYKWEMDWKERTWSQRLQGENMWHVHADLLIKKGLLN